MFSGFLHFVPHKTDYFFGWVIFDGWSDKVHGFKCCGIQLIFCCLLFSNIFNRNNQWVFFFPFKPLTTWGCPPWVWRGWLQCLLRKFLLPKCRGGNASPPPNKKCLSSEGVLQLPFPPPFFGAYVSRRKMLENQSSHFWRKVKTIISLGNNLTIRHLWRKLLLTIL